MPSSLERDAARLFCVGFSGVQPPEEFVELVRRGVRCSILFSRNLGQPAEVSELSRTLKALVSEPFGLFVDQEGGKVQRLRNGFTEIPPLRALGQRSERESSGPTPAVSAEQLAFRTGSLIGSELRAVGIDVALAPVLDVDTNPANPVIGERSFSRDPQVVARLGVALSRGLIQAGVGACAKHFPGHGDTALDSHLALPRLEHSLERMNAVELLPFRAAIAAGIPAIMTAHVVFSALDPELPATLSPAVLRLLREELGFGGLIVSDDSEMLALVDHFGLEEAVVLGISAGLDLFLVCHTPSRAARGIDALVRAVEGGRLPRARVTEAARRVDAFLARFAGPPAADFSRLRCPEHLALAEELISPTVQR
jgi:beta-N-acetylhexosaminidase